VPLIRVTSEGNGIRLSQTRFYSNGGTSSTNWHVPVVAALGAPPDWRGIVSRDKPVTVKTGATAIVNEEQAGYFRTLYDARLFAKIISAFPASSAADQLGILNDSLAFGYSGYAPPSDFLALANTATADADPTVLGSVARAIEDIDVLYEGLPGNNAFSAYGRNLLDPIFAKTGWTGAPEETQNTALLREELLSALSELDDPAVVEGAKARFQAYLKDPSSLSADLRHSVLSIVAQHADAQTWDQLHALAKSAKSALEKEQLYRLLGTTKDKALALRALALAITDEIPATTRPTIVRAVSWRFPDLAVDFAASHWDAVSADLEPDSRAEYVPDLASNALDTSMIAKLRAFAAAHIPANARGDERKAESTIAFHAKVRAQCLPQIDRWLAQRGK
jgi:aminopeptidase N